MLYSNIEKAVFRSRPNRFIAICETQNGVERVHVKNTGRCAELLVPGCTVYLTRSENPARKTAADLVAVKKGPLLINMDSYAPNLAAGEWLAGGGFLPFCTLRPEYRVGDSRFDFYAEEADGTRWLIEVKGCTLEQDGLGLFPDAPTLRGLKHVQELTALAAEGWHCAILIVIAMKGVHTFMPNDGTQPAFGRALAAAEAAGVKVIARDCLITPDSMKIADPVAVKLPKP